jgi:hypothetical protein
MEPSSDAAKNVDELLDDRANDIDCCPASGEEGDTSCRASLSASPFKGSGEAPILDSNLTCT